MFSKIGTFTENQILFSNSIRAIIFFYRIIAQKPRNSSKSSENLEETGSIEDQKSPDHEGYMENITDVLQIVNKEC